jgi:FMN phosphatase YigB (HAD superfamily)
MKVLALDAMGVIYQSGDDVVELLVPYIRKHREESAERIKSLYHQCSLGAFASSVFWEQLGLSPETEDDYLSNHCLVSGTKEFIADARESFDRIWCLSNDVSEWSITLRRTFDLETLFDGFVISGDVKTRKPSPEMYEAFCVISKSKPEEILLIDDRPGNVFAAKSCGMESLLFGEQSEPIQGLPHARDYSELRSMILTPSPEN